MNKRKIAIISLVLVASVLFLTAGMVLAQTTAQYQGTSSLSNTTSNTTATATGNSGLIPCGGPNNPCTICYMVLMIQNLINFGFKIFVYIGILMIVIAGITYIVSAGSPKMMETAKAFLKNALIGFGVMLGAWIIVNTIMLVLGAKTNLGITEAGNWYTFKCIPQSQLFNQQSSSTSSSSNSSSSSTPTSTGAVNSSSSSSTPASVGSQY
jgi:hypothetical protein